MQKTDRKNSHEVETFSLLTANKARESLKNIDGWQLTDDHKMIYREFILQGFMAAIDKINRIALIAEDEKHHPDIHLTQYRNLRVGLTTHDAGGLSDKDFIVAKKINDLPILNKAVPVNQQLKNKESLQPRPKQAISPAPKKSLKAKGIKTKKSSNRMGQTIKKI